MQVNEGFYRAFESGNLDEMARVWSCSEQDRCIHPGWPILEGWDAVRSSWEGIFRGTKGIRVQLEQVRVQIVGEVACVTCVERFSGVAGAMPVDTSIAATNLYRHEGERWVLVLHHGSPLNSDTPPDRGERDRTLH